MEVSRDVHRADEHIAAQPYDRSDDGLNAADGGDHAALVVVRTHPSDPAVLERGPIGIDGPAAHLHARVHVPVEHEAAAAAARALWFTTLKARAFIFR